VSQIAFINALITTPHVPQIIHQKGILIFANVSAARLFGFSSAADFVEFAHRTNLFGNAESSSPKTRARKLNFRKMDGTAVSAQVEEKAIIWNGNPCAHVKLTPTSSSAADNDSLMDTTLSLRLVQRGEEEAYFLDSINAAMDTTREDSGKFACVRRPFDLAAACLRLCDDLAPFAEQMEVTLSLEISPKALNIFVGDAAKLTRAATCVVRHAIARVPGGRVRIKLLVDELGESIRFDVCDSGPPYTSWESVSLLDPPPIDKDVTTYDFDLPELDLPMAQCIANFLGGIVSLKVNHSGGGLIRLKLPFPIAEGEVRRAGRPKDTHLPLRILVAEDNFTSQQVIKIILQALGYAPTIVANGAHCIEALNHSAYDLILMDLHMPVMDGYEATRNIRASEAVRGTPPTPILALTADPRAKTRLKSRAAGVTGFLTKPVHIPQILNALTPIIDDIRAKSEPEATTILQEAKSA
jgi:two-component system, sensor histidine kinase